MVEVGGHPGRWLTPFALLEGMNDIARFPPSHLFDRDKDADTPYVSTPDLPQKGNGAVAEVARGEQKSFVWWRELRELLRGKRHSYVAGGHIYIYIYNRNRKTNKDSNERQSGNVQIIDNRLWNTA